MNAHSQPDNTACIQTRVGVNIGKGTNQPGGYMLPWTQAINYKGNFVPEVSYFIAN